MHSNQSIADSGLRWHMMRPDRSMGPEVWGLIQRCPPLDLNSRYLYLIQGLHHASTSMVATNGRGDVIAYVSGYLIPDKPHTLFIWQVAVEERYRGHGLASEMILGILQRKACEGVSFLETTITLSNEASWGLFKGIADRLKAKSNAAVVFESRQHFDGQHETEMMVSIGPFTYVDEEERNEYI